MGQSHSKQKAKEISLAGHVNLETVVLVFPPPFISSIAAALWFWKTFLLELAEARWYG